MGRFERRIALAGLVAALTVATAGVAAAGVSDGSYRPERMHCTGHADDASTPDRAEPGCRNLIGSVSDGNGNGEVNAGTQQTADGVTVDPTHPITDTDPSGFDPTTGARVFFGADDNLDTGEHDSSALIGDGPSDGGAVVLDVSPMSMARWVAAVQAADLAYLLAHPVPLVGAGFGSCADGICESIQSERRVAYQGGATDGRGRHVADYDGKQWDPESCAGPSDTPADCGGSDITYWHDQEGSVRVEPGIQVYEDPSPEGSPIGPYPLPAVYVGPCGLILGGGAVQAPASPLTNGAGQLVVGTAC
jgi:hypothetical protein